MDSKKCLRFVQIYTDSNKIMLNLNSSSISSKKVDNDKQIQNANVNENEKKSTCCECISKSFAYLGNVIAKSMRTMCCFNSKEELMSFIVYKDKKNPINYAQLNLFFLVCFSLDLILWSVVPLFFHAKPLQNESVGNENQSEWGRGMLWGAHIFMGSYFFIMFWVEYFLTQYLYSITRQQITWSRILYPFKPCLFSFLAKLDIYTDVCMTVEIFKWKDDSSTSGYFIALFVVSFILFCISVNRL